MFHEVGREFGHDEGDIADRRLIDPRLLGEPYGGPPRRGRLTLFRHRNTHLSVCRLADHFHLTMRTVVPLPGFDSIANSLTSRFEPLNPNPNPPRVV